MPVAAARVLPELRAERDDPAWQNVVAWEMTSSPHLASDPAPSRLLPTQIQLLWSPDHLFVRFSGRDAAGRAPHGRRQDAAHHEGEVVEVFLDFQGEGRSYLEIQVNPQGGWLDGLHIVNGSPESTPEGVLTPSAIETHHFDPGLDLDGLRVASSLEDGQWLVDLAIPAMKGITTAGGAFRLGALRGNFLRYGGTWGSDGKRVELLAMNWVPVLRGCPHLSPTRMGWLDLQPPREINAQGR
jgi:hypothetical protein